MPKTRKDKNKAKFAKKLPGVIKRRKEGAKDKREKEQRLKRRAQREQEQNETTKQEQQAELQQQQQEQKLQEEGLPFADLEEEVEDEEEEEEELSLDENEEGTSKSQEEPEREEEVDKEETAGMEEEIAKHRQELEKLKEQDPEFFEFLQKNDPSLLSFSAEQQPAMNENEEEEQEKEEKIKEAAEDEEEELGNDFVPEIEKKERKVVSNALLDDLEEKAEKSIDALKRLTLVFKSACYVGEEEENVQEKPEKGKTKKPKQPNKKAKRPLPTLIYRIPNSDIFNRVMVFSLTNMRKLLETHILTGIPEGKLEKASASSTLNEGNGLTEQQLGKAIKLSSKWKSLFPVAKSFLGSSLHLLGKLNDKGMCSFTLRHLERHTMFFAHTAPLARRYLHDLLNLWSSSNDETTRFLAFGNLHGLATSCPQPFVDLCIKGAYLIYVRNSQFVTRSNLPLLQFMRNCISELCGINQSSAYRVAFTYIRQLAVHLRGVVLHTQTDKDARKAIHNWQFINALHAWSDALISHAPRSESLQQLIFPLLQVIMGVIDLSQGARNLGIRFQCLHMLLNLSVACNVFANPIPALIQSIEVTEMKHKPKSSSSSSAAVKSLDFDVTLHVQKTYLGSSQLQEAVIAQVNEIALHFLASQSYSIAFPEIALPAVVFLRRYKKECKIPQLSHQISALLEKIQENVAFINKHRSKVDFSPKDIDKVRSFLGIEKEKEASPLNQAWKRFEQQRNMIKAIQQKAESQAASASSSSSKKQNKQSKQNKKKKEKESDDDNDDDDNNDDMSDEENEAEEQEYSEGDGDQDYDDYDDDDGDMEDDEEKPKGGKKRRN